jgi:hypothetical protein
VGTDSGFSKGLVPLGSTQPDEVPFLFGTDDPIEKGEKPATDFASLKEKTSP